MFMFVLATCLCRSMINCSNGCFNVLKKCNKCVVGVPIPSIYQNSCLLNCPCDSIAWYIGVVFDCNVVKIACVGAVECSIFLMYFSRIAHCCSAPFLYCSSWSGQFNNQCWDRWGSLCRRQLTEWQYCASLCVKIFRSSIHPSIPSIRKSDGQHLISHFYAFPCTCKCEIN